MTRVDPRPILALGLSLAILAHVGCTRTIETPSPGSTSPQSAGPGAAPTGGGKLFADWPGLQAALVISGEMHAYLEPCGCTAGQLGGLGRRLDLLDRMTAQGIASAKIDLGALTKDPATARGGIAQARIKFETTLKALQAMKYDALALAPEDLKFGLTDTLTAYLNNKDTLKVVSANLTPVNDFKGVFDDTIRRSVVAQAGPYKVGITAVVDPAEYAKLKDADTANLAITPPELALPPVLADLEAKSDLQVVLVQGPVELAKSIAEANPGIEVVVSTSPFADPADKPELLNGGKTQVVQVGQKGKYVGVVGLFKPEGGKGPATRYARITLNGNKYRNAEPMRALIDEEMQAQFKALGVVANHPRRANATAPGATYVGADSCKTCHPNTFLKWAGTNHAHAYDVLVKDPKDARRKRESDAECISCHTTGFGYTSGWVSAEKTPYLKGNQCENCHGPASRHVADPDLAEARKSLALTAERADKGGLCHSCHDDDNSPKFDFSTYYGKIAHKGMDTYDDPRVHKKSPPKQADAAD